MFDAINRTVGGSAGSGAARVKFALAMLQKLPLGDGSLDAICCISVLEHTSNYGEIVREFARCLRGGGLLVLTFDLSLDGKFELDKPTAAKLLHAVAEYFSPRGVPADQGMALWEAELNRMDDPAQRDLILSTDHVRRTRPELLPWRYPMAKAVHDLIKGHGWTGGFRSKSVFCLEAVRKHRG
jgi:SAM-dependent methyltransferase